MLDPVCIVGIVGEPWQIRSNQGAFGDALILDATVSATICERRAGYQSSSVMEHVWRSDPA